MKKFLIPESGKFYKANLHTHTNISDGSYSPQQIKEVYMKEGYSVVAFTDHDLFALHHDLTDENFLALSGFEVEINEDNSYPCKLDFRTCHICCIAKSKDAEIQPCWNPKYAYIGNAKNNHHLIKYDQSKPFYERNYSADSINEMIAEFKKQGFFVTYNHPTWSLEDYEIYTKYKGIDAFEIYNHGAYKLGYPAYLPTIYNDILKHSGKVFVVAADDVHSSADKCGGFVMIKAEKLEYETITKALENGDFYASTGPEIKELYVEDGKVFVKCSEAVSVTINTNRRRAKGKFAQNGELVTFAEFSIDEKDEFIRITVIDSNGKFAETRAYFADELA